MHNPRGNTLALTVAISLILALIGIFVFFAGRTFAGAREMANLTDSGGLNCGKQLITAIGRPLAAGIEQQHFAYLVDTNGTIDLRVYNRIIAQTLLIGLNAQAEGTQTAKDNANQLLYAVQGSPTSISAWLTTQLSQSGSALTPFLQVASSGNLRMLGTNCSATYDNNGYAVSYVNPGYATNVFLDQTILPGGLPNNLLSSQSGPTGFQYMLGYQNIDAGVFMIEGTPVMPGQQPHLIADRDFNAGLTAPMTGSGGFVPPNAFRTVSTSTGTIQTTQGLTTKACAVVGALGAAYSASIPEGYLQIINSGPTTDSVSTLLNNVNPTWASQVIQQLVQRMRETQPTMTVLSATNLLNSINVGSGQTVFIYLNPANNTLTYSSGQPPKPTFGTGMSADGVPQPWVNQSLVNGNYVTTASGTFTPSCGLNNLLGVVNVANYPQEIVTADGSTADGSSADGGGGDGGGGGGGDGGCGDGGGGDGGDGS